MMGLTPSSVNTFGETTPPETSTASPFRKRLGAARVRCDDVDRAELIRPQHLCERLVRHVAGAEARWCGFAAGTGCGLADDDESIGVDERERAEPHGVDHAECRDASANRNRE